MAVPHIYITIISDIRVKLAQYTELSLFRQISYSQFAQEVLNILANLQLRRDHDFIFFNKKYGFQTLN